ncbi:MAG: metallophosphoesterase [Lachnospiraceae bacterium]|nr:metallophosphoesterase [Lachnospiraceae bacterium]
MTDVNSPNYKWIYTYDYAPDSVWDPWREPDQDLSWIEAEAEAVAARVKKRSLSAFILLADSHFAYNGTWDDTMTAMRTLTETVNPLAIIHLGDLHDGLLPLNGTHIIETKCIADMKSLGLPLYIAPGNHDYNYFRGNPEIKYPDRPQFYTDVVDHKLRLVFIDSFDPRETVRYGFTEYCCHWLDATLSAMPEGYSAIVFSHLTPLIRLQAWAKDIRNRQQLIEVLNKHADRILAFINGHNHCDHLYNDLYNGQFPIISINCAKCEYFTDHKPEGAVVPERRLGDRTQESFDVMQVDTAGKEIFFTRFGAGTDRVLRDHKAYYI